MYAIWNFLTAATAWSRPALSSGISSRRRSYSRFSPGGASSTIMLWTVNHRLVSTISSTHSSVAANHIIDLIGNQSQILKLRSWLKSWKPAPPKPKKEPGKKKRKKSAPKGGPYAALLSGPPGIGKTSSAEVIAEELGYTIKAFNASNARSEAQLKKAGLQFATQGYGLDRLVKGKKTLIIMDEVDGMSQGDRGGNAYLIKLIKWTKVPIICICNDRWKDSVKTLAKQCIDIRYTAPNPQIVAHRVAALMRQQGFENVDVNTLARLCAAVNGDIRQTITMAQMQGRTSKRLDRTDNAFARDMAAGRSGDIDNRSLVQHMFNRRSQHNASDDLGHFLDGNYSILPAYVHWNYFGSRTQKSRNNPERLMSHFLEGLDDISMGDVMHTQLMETQQWSLLEHVGAVAFLKPAFHARQCLQARSDFPSSLGKMSTRNKNKRTLAGVQPNMSLRTLLGPLPMSLDYLPAFLAHLAALLRVPGKESITKVVEAVRSYQLKQIELEPLFELRSPSGTWKSIPGSVRGALTRALKKLEEEKTEPTQKRPATSRQPAKTPPPQRSKGPKKRAKRARKRRPAKSRRPTKAPPKPTRGSLLFHFSKAK